MNHGYPEKPPSPDVQLAIDIRRRAKAMDIALYLERAFNSDQSLSWHVVHANAILDLIEGHPYD